MAEGLSATAHVMGMCVHIHVPGPGALCWASLESSNDVYNASNEKTVPLPYSEVHLFVTRCKL